MQIIFFSVWFFYGNAVYMKSLNPGMECNAVYADAAIAAQQAFSPKVLQAVMGILMLFHWFVFIAFVQLLLFTLMLWSLWDGVVHATKRMQQGFSISSLIELLMEAIGEGELQDSVMIGGIQYLMNDESYYCKRCKKPFSQLQMQANEFEAT